MLKSTCIHNVAKIKTKSFYIITEKIKGLQALRIIHCCRNKVLTWNTEKELSVYLPTQLYYMLPVFKPSYVLILSEIFMKNVTDKWCFLKYF